MKYSNMVESWQSSMHFSVDSSMVSTYYIDYWVIQIANTLNKWANK